MREPTIAIAVALVAIACSSAVRYPACNRDEECSVSGKHDYCVSGKCVYCRTAVDCGDRQRCTAGRCEADPNAPPPVVDAGDDGATDASDEETEEVTPPPADEEHGESHQHILPRGVRRYLRP